MPTDADALSPALVDLPLGLVNQTPSRDQGVLGRLDRIVDGQVTAYEQATQQTPGKWSVKPRPGWTSFADVAAGGSSAVSGSPVTPSFTGIGLLADYGSSVVSIAGTTPQVSDSGAMGPTRVHAGDVLIPASLSRSELQTNSGQAWAPDSAVTGDARFVAWTEVTGLGPLPATATVYGAVYTVDGGLVRAPFALLNGSAYYVTKVAADLTGNFWLCVREQGSIVVYVYVFSGTGAQLSSATLTDATSNTVPGAFDIQARPSGGGIYVACPKSTSSNAGVWLWELTYAAGIISGTTAMSVSIPCNSGIAWLTNISGDGAMYLATTSGGALYWHQVTLPSTFLAFVTSYSLASPNLTLDTLTGVVVANGGGSVPYITVGTLRSAPATDGGPPYDPGLRTLVTSACSRAGTSTVTRVQYGVVAASRAVAIGGAAFVAAYYQGGGGLGAAATNINVPVASSGDYFIGGAEQPLPVSPGDSAYGLVQAHARATYVTQGYGSAAPATGSTVALYTWPAGGGGGIPDGAELLQWNFAGTAYAVNTAGGTLEVSGFSDPGLDGSWAILVAGANTLFTYRVTDQGTRYAGTGGLTGTSGTWQVRSNTGYLMDVLPFAAPFVPGAAITANYLFRAGGVTTTGSSTAGNNVTSQSIIYCEAQPTRDWGIFSVLGNNSVWVATTSQSTNDADAVTVLMTPTNSVGLSLAAVAADSSYDGGTVQISGDSQVAANNQTYTCTGGSLGKLGLVAGANGLLPEVFAPPYPTVMFMPGLQTPLSIHLANATPDYTWVGGTLVLAGTGSYGNDGSYLITGIATDPVTSEVLILLQAPAGATGQRNEALTTSQSVFVYLPAAAAAASATQPTWLLVPIYNGGTQAVSGLFDSGLAFADWRFDGSNTPTPEFLSVSSWTSDLAGNLYCVLPYRAELVVSQSTEPVSRQTITSTVGLRVFSLSAAPNSVGGWQSDGRVTVGGPKTSVYSQTFDESGINLGPEAPFVVSQSVGTGPGLAANQQYQYVVVYEAVDQAGRRIWSVPSPPLTVQLSYSNVSGTLTANNRIVLGGRLGYGLPANYYGVTDRNVTISVYRTWVDPATGVPSTLHRKITLDLSPNAPAPVSGTNPSGFSFPDAFSWRYIDQNQDVQASVGELLYTDGGELPHYPCPPCSRGVGSYRGREYVVAYDGAVWVSSQATEGIAQWYSPQMRVTFPGGDAPVTIAALDDYLIVHGSRSCWALAATQLPDGTGAGGAVPDPQLLPFQAGSVNGLSVTCRVNNQVAGVAYDSTYGGVWLITRDLQHEWLSEAIRLDLSSPGDIRALAVDGKQRLLVLSGTSPELFVFDGVPGAWYEWTFADSPLLLSTGGSAWFSGGSGCLAVATDASYDTLATGTAATPLSILVSPYNLGNVRGLKRIWELNLSGQYLGPHTATITLYYTAEGGPGGPATQSFTVTPTGAVPYVYQLYPVQQETTQLQVAIYLAPSALSWTAEINGLSALVGLGRGFRLPATQTAVAS